MHRQKGFAGYKTAPSFARYRTVLGFAPIIIFIAILVLGGLVGGAYYLGKQSNQIPQVAKESVPTISLPSPTPDPTANWKTYRDQSISFKYPQDWNASGYIITSRSSTISIVVVTRDSSLMNECMQAMSTETKNGLYIKKFSRITTGAMCETKDSTPREIWIMPSTNAHSPGVMYRYQSTEALQAESIFNQILSTFRFIQ